MLSTEPWLDWEQVYVALSIGTLRFTPPKDALTVPHTSQPYEGIFARVNWVIIDIMPSVASFGSILGHRCTTRPMTFESASSHQPSHSATTSPLAPLLLAFLEHLLHNLLLLNEEGTRHAVLDAVGASRATVRTLDSLLRLGDGGILARAEGRNAAEGSISFVHNINWDRTHP